MAWLPVDVNGSRPWDDETRRREADAPRTVGNTLGACQCQHCGSAFGMRCHYRDTLAGWPVQWEMGEVPHRSEHDEPDANWIWLACAVCNLAGDVPDTFRPMDKAEYNDFMKGENDVSTN